MLLPEIVNNVVLRTIKAMLWSKVLSEWLYFDDEVDLQESSVN